MLLMQDTGRSQGFFLGMGKQTHNKSRHTTILQVIYIVNLERWDQNSEGLNNILATIAEVWPVPVAAWSKA